MPRLVPLLLAALLTATAADTPALEPLDADALSDTLRRLIDTHPTAKRTNVALKVTDLETGRVLFDQHSDKLFTPASNLKIYTSAAALALLGPDHRWTTRVAWHSHNFLPGIALLPGADPMLDMTQLNEIAERTAKAIREHDPGEIGPNYMDGFMVSLLSNKAWRHVPLKGPGWMWDDDPDYYNMSIRDIMLDFNVLTAIAKPDPEGPLISVSLRIDPQSGKHIRVPSALFEKFPRSAYPSENFQRAHPNRDGYTLADPDRPLSLTRRPFEDEIIVEGNIEPDAGPVKERLTVHDPRPWVSSVFANLLLEQNLPLTQKNGHAIYEHGLYASAMKPNVFIEHQGKTNAEAVKHFLKVSENAVGEMLLLTLSEKFGDGEKVSWPSGAKVITNWLTDEAGLEKGSFRLVDGSGLSRYNLISADSSIRLLSYMKNDSEHFEPFFDGLPVYKVKLPKGGGEKWGGVPLAEFDTERVFAKSGGMSGVSTISGYVQTLDGRWLAFSLLGNGFIGSAAPVRDLRNQVWAELVRYQPAAAAVPAE
ncbi:MAG: D-alanyl-D-alanine carboxypeptidase [Planctomycetota bacterium]